MAGAPFLVVNPRSGSGEPTAEELAAAAREAGAEAHVLLPGEDAAALARAAAERGAGALGVAGGDGTLGAVAAVALERDLPLLCIPFGTRNHFARDLGLDVDEPLAALAALRADEERAVDVGTVGGRVFVNNVSLGIYASLVHDPRRRTKNRLAAATRLVPAAFGVSRRPLRLSFEGDGQRRLLDVLVLLVGNNAYELETLAGLGRRDRLDEGLLHAYAVEAAGRLRVLALFVAGALGRLERVSGWSEWTAAAFRVDSRRRRIHAALDGEPVHLVPPLDFAIRPRALRVLVPPAS